MSPLPADLWSKPRRARPRLIEDPIQEAIVNTLRVSLPPAWIVHHSPNGLKRSKAAGGRAKSLGTLAGYPDLVIHGRLQGRPWTGFLEVKVPGRKIIKGGRQEAVIGKLMAAGYPVAVVSSIDEAIARCRLWGLPIRIAGMF